ncbi:DUF72 domain-containing protein [Sphingobacterium daejeonense]|uniref:DUF72 domain-containing protein n=1 Tax=Sphingobacterium daejeonense TaxID=371142 RepID=UPI0010C2E7D3|nr:DUF72 domain-containing protein [Sphingobacterium daejeonense]VTQ02060.1 Protein of uncharacterised function DUF72 [Sphingobacterium daejeonense]
MKFGKVEDPSQIDFSLPVTPKETIQFLNQYKSEEGFEINIGYPKWSKADLKGFYPRGTKDELRYYSEEFNSVEFNGTFYRSPSKEQVLIWKNRTSDDFKFCPKFTNSISHYSRLNNTDEKVAAFVDSTVLFEEKLGMGFIQMPENFRPKAFDRLEGFLNRFPKGYPLAFEVRHEEWYNDEQTLNKYLNLLKKTNTTNIIVDTPGRRDMLNFRLTTPVAFIRFVSSTDVIDKLRLSEWVTKIKEWKEVGLKQVYFFVHQKIDPETPFLSTDFVKELNVQLGCKLPIAQKKAL